MEEIIDKSLLQIQEEISVKQFDKINNYYYLLDFWMQALENNKSVNDYLCRLGYKRVAIYGMGALGKHLCKQIENFDYEIVTIDKMKFEYNAHMIELNSETVKYIDVDLIIITPVMEYYEIKQELKELLNNIPIMSLEELIMSL